MAEPLLQVFGPGAKNTQSSLTRATTPDPVSDISRGRLVAASLAAATPQAIIHNLGRLPKGIIPVDINSAGFPTFRTTAKDSSTITVEADVEATVSFWVF